MIVVVNSRVTHYYLHRFIKCLVLQAQFFIYCSISVMNTSKLFSSEQLVVCTVVMKSLFLNLIKIILLYLKYCEQ
jgi:hypothetical protein